MSMRALLWFHRWLGLAVVLFWVCQALTGLALLFHWEWDEATIAAAHRPTDLVAIGRSFADIAPERTGMRVTSLSTSAGAPDRYDVEVSRGPGDEIVRIDGMGKLLRVRPADGGWFEGGAFDGLALPHVELLSGDRGTTIVGISGILLASNLLVGLLIVLSSCAALP